MTLELEKQKQQTIKHSKSHLNDISLKYEVIMFYPNRQRSAKMYLPWNYTPQTEIQSQLISKYSEK